MQKSSTAQSPTQATQASRSPGKLDPVLQNVLIGLDVQLEEEFIRYRRQRALGQTSYKPSTPSFRKISSALKTISGGAASLSLPSIATEASTSHSHSNSSSHSTPAESTTAFHPTINLPSFNDVTHPLAPGSSSDRGEPTNDSETLLIEEDLIDNEANAPGTLTSDRSFLELKELAEQYASQVADSSALTLAEAGGPDDYLESSEELLRALSREEAEVQAEQSFMQSLLTPLGFGSMLLLLLSSAMFGFVITNPNSVSQLFALQEKSPSATSENSSVSVPTPAQTSDLPQPNLAHQEFPELSVATLGTIKIAPENSLPSPTHKTPQASTPSALINIGLSGTTGSPIPSTLKTVPSESQATEAAPPTKAPAGDIPSPRKLAPAPEASAPAPVQRSNPAPSRSYSPPPARTYSPAPPVRSYNPAPVRPSNPAPRAYRSEPIQPFRPAAPKTSTSSSGISAGSNATERTVPTPVPPAPNNVTASGSSSGYKVVTPYTSDRALEEARQQVPDAYVKNYPDGAKVQFGAYSDEATASAQVEALQKQGIPAEVYKP